MYLTSLNEGIGYNRFETSAVWFETMEKQLLLNSVEVVERKTNCVFLLSLCGSFECTLATPVLIFERGAKKFFRCISAKHHTSHNVWMEPSIKWHPWEDQTNTLDHPSRRKLAAPIRLLNKAKRFANQLLSNVMNASACVYSYFLRAEQMGWRRSPRRRS